MVTRHAFFEEALDQHIATGPLGLMGLPKREILLGYALPAKYWEL